MLWIPSVFLLAALGSSSQCLATSVTSTLQIRGGVGYNPNFVPPPPPRQRLARPVTLGDLDNPHAQQHNLWVENESYGAPLQNTKDTSIWQTISDYTKRLHQTSPTLSFVSMVCIAIFVLWQIPPCQRILSNHFVCSWSNLPRRPHSLLLSAVSHSSVMHLLMNLMAFTSFGPPLRQTLKATNWPLWPLVVGAAMSGSMVFLIKGRGACLGLSGVTLAFLALQAKLFPDRQLGTVLGVFLVKVPAHLALKLLLIVSALGSLDRSSSVAHLAHLGGLLYGMAYYELWLRRNWLRKFSRQVQTMFPRRK